MPGLYGIAGENIRRSWSRLVEATRRVAATDDLHITNFEEENVCFGKTDHGLFFPSQQPLWDRSGKYAIIADGYIVINNDISDSTDRAGETLSLLLESYVRGSDDTGLRAGCPRSRSEIMIGKIRTGVFNVLIYDSVHGEIILVNDRLGVYPLYYYKGKNFIFSYNIRAILETEDVRKEADAIALAELLIIGYPLKDRVYIKGLKRMPSASVLTYNISNRTIHIRKYFADKRLRQPAGKYAFLDYVEEASSLFEQACRRLYLPARKHCLMLSGGCDSRLILAAWPSLENIFSLSWGEKNSLELRIARRLAEIKGINHYSMEVEGDSITKVFQDTFYETGNLRYPNRIVGAREMKRLGAEIAVDGFLGGPVIAGRGFDIKGGTLEQIVNALFLHYATNRDFCKKFLTNDAILFVEESKDEIKKDIEDVIKSYRNSWDSIGDEEAGEGTGPWTARANGLPSGPPDQIVFRELANLFRIYMYNRQGVFLQGIATRSQLEIIYPFVDYNFYDFCMTVPVNLISGHKLHMKIFKHTYSQYSSVAYSRSLLPLTFPSGIHKVSERINHIIFDTLLHKAQRVFKRELFPIQWTWDNWDKWIRHNSFKNAFWGIISDSGVVDYARAKNMMEAHERYDLSILYGLQMLSLLGFALWVKELEWEIS